MRPTATTIRVSEAEFKRLSNVRNHRTIIKRKTNESNHGKLLREVIASDQSIIGVKPIEFKTITFVCGDKQVTRRCSSVYMDECEDDNDTTYFVRDEEYVSAMISYYLHEIVNL